MKLLVHSPNSTAAPFKCGNGPVIHPHSNDEDNYSYMQGLKLIVDSKRGPRPQCVNFFHLGPRWRWNVRISFKNIILKEDILNLERVSLGWRKLSWKKIFRSITSESWSNRGLFYFSRESLSKYFHLSCCVDQRAFSSSSGHIRSKGNKDIKFDKITMVRFLPLSCFFVPNASTSMWWPESAHGRSLKARTVQTPHDICIIADVLSWIPAGVIKLSPKLWLQLVLSPGEMKMNMNA